MIETVRSPKFWRSTKPGFVTLRGAGGGGRTKQRVVVGRVEKSVDKEK